MHAPPTHYHRHHRRPLDPSPFISRVSFPCPSIPSHRRDSVEKLTRVVGQRIRNYDLSRRRDYPLLRRLWNPGPRSVLLAYVQPYLLLVLRRDVVSWDFLSKFITKADQARRSNVDIRLIKDTPVYVNESGRWRELHCGFYIFISLIFEMKVRCLSVLL